MRKFSTNELERMRLPHGDAMLDTALILTYAAGAQDAHGTPVETYTPASVAISCGYRPGSGAAQPSQAEHMDNARVPEALGIFRLPVGTVIAGKDRIRLTHRAGRLLSPAVDYQIVGDTTPGMAALLVKVRSVTDGS